MSSPAIRRPILAIASSVLAVLFIATPIAYASPYGGGAYGSCPYSQDCASSSSNPATQNTTSNSSNQQPSTSSNNPQTTTNNTSNSNNGNSIATTNPSTTKQPNHFGLILSIGAIIAALLIWLIIFLARRRHGDETDS